MLDSGKRFSLTPGEFFFYEGTLYLARTIEKPRNGNNCFYVEARIYLPRHQGEGESLPQGEQYQTLDLKRVVVEPSSEINVVEVQTLPVGSPDEGFLFRTYYQTSDEGWKVPCL
jgi:hypothetical protein